MDNRAIIEKLRECAKNLLDLARELQVADRVASPLTMDLIASEVAPLDGKAHNYALPFVLGQDEFGTSQIIELARLPHLLIGGGAGRGKTVCLNSLIAGLISTKSPDEVRLIVYDPKCVEFAWASELPHLILPVITSDSRMLFALRWLVCEMEKRLKMFARAYCRNIVDFNARTVKQDSGDETPRTVPYIVAVFDEFADLMTMHGKEVEPLVSRITAKARAAGIHIVIATSRPDCKVVTGLLKSNMPGRLAFKTVSGIDSRTIIDDVGAENLFGRGDFLFRSGSEEIVRGQGAYISDAGICELVSAAVGKYGQPKCADEEDEVDSGSDYERVIALIRKTGKASISHFQRCLGFGYNHSAELMDRLESAGLVGTQKGAGPREVFWDKFPME